MVYQFGNVELDTSNYQLLCDGELITTEPLVFNLISFLVENHKRVVSRNEILETLWPNRIVSDASLSNAINGARKALMDQSNNPKLIKTVRGRGYQFIAKIVRPPAPTFIEASPEKVSTDEIRKWVKNQSLGPRVAILPFDSQSMPAGSEYISSGLFDDILSELCRSKEIQVISSLSVLFCEEKGIDVQAQSRELNIDYIVQGSVGQVSPDMVLSINMTDTSSQQMVLAEKYLVSQADMMTLDNRVARRIVNTLLEQVRTVEYQHTQCRSSSSYGAYDYYLRGEYFANRLHLDINNLERASVEFGKALALDPEFGRVRALKARADGFHHMDNPEMVRKTIQECERGLSSDPQDGLVHLLLAQQYLHLRNFDLADFHYCRAMQLSPSNNVAYCRAGNFFTYTGEYDKADATIDYGRNLSPTGGCFDLGYLAILQYNQGEYDSAIQNIKKVWHPDDYEPMLLAACHAAKNEWTEARSYVEQVKKMSPHKTASFFANNEPYKDEGKQELLKERLIKAGMVA